MDLPLINMQRFTWINLAYRLQEEAWKSRNVTASNDLRAHGVPTQSDAIVYKENPPFGLEVYACNPYEKGVVPANSYRELNDNNNPTYSSDLSVMVSH